jgi:Transposase and inactivated derivatives
MPRSLKIRKPKAVEIRQLHSLLEGELSPRKHRWAQAVLLWAMGMNAIEIAQVLGVHFNTICADLHEFNRHGLSSLQRLRSRGAPVRISETQVAEILRLAQIAPYELGLPYGRWSVRKLRHYLLRHRVLRAISGEHLRRLVKKGGCAFVGFGVSS